MVDERRFRDVMGHLATGVTLVTGRGDQDEVHGLTVNAVASVSLAPSLILVCLDAQGQSHDPILASGHFAVSVLGHSDEELAHRFSRGVRDERFAGIQCRTETSGSPILVDALAWLDCKIDAIHPGGDHTVVVGEVLACGAKDGDPLVFFKGAYGRVTP